VRSGFRNEDEVRRSGIVRFAALGERSGGFSLRGGTSCRGTVPKN